MKGWKTQLIHSFCRSFLGQPVVVLSSYSFISEGLFVYFGDIQEENKNLGPYSANIIRRELPEAVHSTFPM